jgi:hypothetical protein
MTFRRRELEQTLPEANQQLCQYLWQLCNEAGAQISNSDLLFVGRIVADFLKNTENGKHMALTAVGADVRPASILKSYFQSGYLGDDTKKIDPRDLKEYRGFVYKGKYGVPYHQVDIDDREDADACDSCGMRFPVGYCLKPIEVKRADGKGAVESRCNHCRLSSEHQNVRDSASSKTCTFCEKRKCEFHPNYKPPKPLRIAQ